jgi:large subunit ribosomal protein L4
MAKTDLINTNGEKSGTIELSDKIFAVKPNTDLVEQAVRIQLSNARAGTAHTKIRSEVSGGGKKPWRQKGTGNARAGSNRSPLWIGGGITFGPRKEQNWHKMLPKKMLRNAIFAVLSSKLKDNKILIVDKLEFSKISTKSANELLKKMPIKEGIILVIIPKSDMKIELSFRNLSFVKVLTANSLNIYDLLKYNYIIMSKDALEVIETTFLKNKPEKESNTKSKEEKTIKIEKDTKTVKNKTVSKE